MQTPGKGITVAQPSPRDVLDVASVRAALETMAALHVAKNPQGDAMEQLRAALCRHMEAIRQGDLLKAGLTHLDLHRTLWIAPGNQMLNRVWPFIESQIRIAMSLDQVTRSDPTRDVELHQRLIAVITAGDEDAIKAEVRDHIALSASEVIRLIEEGEVAG